MSTLFAGPEPSEPGGSPGVDVVIVNYRSASLAIRCIRSILLLDIARLERIVVVDNNSQDDSVERLCNEVPGLRVISWPLNNGFGAGVNVGMSHVNGEHVLVLNPDTYFETNVIPKVLSVMNENDDIGIVGLDLVNPDGTRQFSARRFYSYFDIAARRLSILAKLVAGRIDRHLMKDLWKREELFDAEWVMGTGFVIRRAVFDAVSGMDERYFLYLEDVDLCARVWNAGYRVVCLPNACLVHDHQRSSAAHPLSFAGRKHIKSLMLFAQKFKVPLLRAPGVSGILGKTSR